MPDAVRETRPGTGVQPGSTLPRGHGRLEHPFIAGRRAISQPSVVNPKGLTMMKSNAQNQEVIVSGIHLELTPSLKYYVNEKFGRLFRHEERIVRIRVELEFDGKNDINNPFVAKGHVVLRGPDFDCSVSSDDCHKSIDLLVDKLDRMLRRRARLWKVKRKHPHAVELGVLLPKTA
jgi:putative sigma-54 modulation protein